MSKYMTKYLISTQFDIIARKSPGEQIVNLGANILGSVGISW